MKNIVKSILGIVIFFSFIACEKHNPTTLFNQMMNEMVSGERYELHKVSWELDTYKIDTLYTNDYGVNEDIDMLVDSISTYAEGYYFWKNEEEKESHSLMAIFGDRSLERAWRKYKEGEYDTLSVCFNRYKELCNENTANNTIKGFAIKYRFSFTDNGETEEGTTVIFTDATMTTIREYGDDVDGYNKFKKGVKILQENDNLDAFLSKIEFLEYWGCYPR